MYGLKNPFHWISQKRIENMFIENLISKMPWYCISLFTKYPQKTSKS
jgi:hypothetical protein